jgi:hypothetical protein
MKGPIVTVDLPLDQAKLMDQALGVILNLSPEDELPILQAGRSALSAAVRQAEIRIENGKTRAA